MNEILTHDMKLLGLKMPHGDEVGSYFEELPEHFTLCLDFRDLYRIKKYKRQDVKDNLEIYLGLDVLIFDPQVKLYYYRTLKEYTDMNKLLKYFKDGNLYVLKDELREKEENPVTEPDPQLTKKEKQETKDEEFLIF